MLSVAAAMRRRSMQENKHSWISYGLRRIIFNVKLHKE